MFVRFRQSGRRLQASLVETRRLDGKVRHEHVASLGSTVIAPSVSDRIAFWQNLHERLARLANRIDAGTQAKILGAVHDRIPMVTMEEIRALQLENAEADERFWSGLQDLHESTAADHAALRDKADRAIAENQAGATNARDGAAAAKDRIERLKKGESIAGGLRKPMSIEDQLDQLGLDKAFWRHCREVGEIDRLGLWDVMRKEMMEATERAHVSIPRKILKRHRRIEELVKSLPQEAVNILDEVEGEWASDQIARFRAAGMKHG